MSPPTQLRADPTIVTPLHLHVIEIVAAAAVEYGLVDLRLNGGTALSAYHLRHRQSEDLDFFAGESMEARDFRSFVSERLDREGLCIVGEGPASRGFAEFLVADQPTEAASAKHQTIKVQFARASPFALAESVPTQEGVRVASYRDLCAGKLHAICDRFEPRDYIDLHFILSRVTTDGAAPDYDEVRRRFRELLKDLQRVDPGLNEAHVGQALARGLGQPIVSAFPLRLVAPVTEETVQRSLAVAHEECARIAAERMQVRTD